MKKRGRKIGLTLGHRYKNSEISCHRYWYKYQSLEVSRWSFGVAMTSVQTFFLGEVVAVGGKVPHIGDLLILR